jgi:hypothetical protein
VMMVAGMILASVMMRSTRRIGIAQDDGELAVDRGQHEAGGNERPQAQHREHPGRGPMSCPVAEALRADSHASQHASRLVAGQWGVHYRCASARSGCRHIMLGRRPARPGGMRNPGNAPSIRGRGGFPVHAR